MEDVRNLKWDGDDVTDQNIQTNLFKALGLGSEYKIEGYNFPNIKHRRRSGAPD